MPHHLSSDLIKERSAHLRKLSESLAHDYAQSFIGKTLKVLWEKDQDKSGRRLGHTANYLTVAASNPVLPAPGTFSQAVIKGFLEPGRLLVKPL